MGIIVAAVGLLSLLMNITKTGLVPQEDMGTISVNAQMAPGSSLSKTERVMRRQNRL
ncbi:MAG: hypothetical protein ACI353_02560 [Alloprevotella sp.]